MRGGSSRRSSKEWLAVTPLRFAAIGLHFSELGSSTRVRVKNIDTIPALT
jgi:hypothetical protein